jgi:hypothetical protein
LALIAFTVLISAGSFASESEAVVPSNLPQIVSSDIAVGSTKVVVPFAVNGCSTIMLEVIVPVDSAQFTLANPAAAVVLASGDPSLHFVAGETLLPGGGLPGGIFTSGEIANPADGNWAIRLSYPSATVPTVAMATIYCKTSYQAGIAMESYRLLAGETAVVGMLVANDGESVTGLSPEITVGLKSDSSSDVTLEGKDDGIDFDGAADDGLYSAVHTFATAGTYVVSGIVAIPTPAGIVTRNASAEVEVIDPGVSVTQVTTGNNYGAGSCITGINIFVTVEGRKSGTFVTAATLKSETGESITVRSRSTLIPGSNAITLTFTADELRQLEQSGPYRIDTLNIFEMTDDDLILVYKGNDVASTGAIALGDLCAAPIELISGFSADKNLEGGFISSLTLKFKLLTHVTGNYQLSFKVVGENGADLGLYSDSLRITAGTPVELSYDIPASDLLTVDGPYSLISLLVLGPGNSMQASHVGTTDAISRWQILPLIMGDLDADGDVDAADRTILNDYRNQSALIPGDRRDIDRDGKVDIGDIRAIQLLSCKSGTCPAFKP